MKKREWMRLMFNALIKKNDKAWWTPAYRGGKRAAEKFMRDNPEVVECSIQYNGRFQRTVREDDDV